MQKNCPISQMALVVTCEIRQAKKLWVWRSLEVFTTIAVKSFLQPSNSNTLLIKFLLMPSTFETKESMCIMNKQNRLPSLYLIFSVVPCSKQQHTHTNAAPCFSDAVFQVISTLPEASIVMCFPNTCLQQWWDRLLIREYVLWFPCAIFIKYIAATVWMFPFKQISLSFWQNPK